MQKPLPTKFSDETGNYDGNDPQGSANLTFTRNSNASRVNSDGKVERVRTNNVLYSQDFTNGWTNGNVTISTSATANPVDGQLTAQDIIPNTNLATHRILRSAGYASSPNTWSIYAKAKGYNYITIVENGNTGANVSFNLSTGVIGQENSAVGQIQSLGEGWYRCSMIHTTIAGSPRFDIYISPTDSLSAYSGDGTSGVTLFGAQAEVSDFGPTPYIPTTTSARSTFAGITVDGTSVPNVPRLDYSDGATCGRLILEPQRTNVCLWSESIDNAGWSKVNTPTITTNIATAPDGYGGADGIQDTDGLAFRRVSQSFSVSANSTCTISVFVKKEISETNYGGLSFDFTGGTRKLAYIIVDAVNGTAINSTSSTLSATTTVTDFGNYWRISATTTDNGTNTSCAMSYYATLATAPSGSASLGAGSVRTVWGFQMEIGASYATSYIGPTLGASVTRLADSASRTNIANLIGQTEGTLFVEFEHSITNTTEDTRFILSDNTYNNWTFFSIENGTSMRYYLTSGGVNQLDSTVSNVFPTAGKYKVALAYQDDLLTIYVNGVQKVNNTNSTTIPAMSVLLLSGKEAVTSAVELVNKNINQALLFKTRLTNAQLAELTTL